MRSRRLRILVDLLFYSGTKGGMESYARSVYSHMNADDLEFVGLASTELWRTGAEWFPGELIDSGIAGDDRRAWAWGELTAVGRTASRTGADLIHAPANVGPWRAPVPVVLTVHDLLPFRHPSFVPGPYAPVLRTLIRGAARNARRVLTISESSKADIVRYLGKNPDLVDVAPLAGHARPGLPNVPREPSLLLALGNRMPHKNFETLIRAVAAIPAEIRPRLIITGSHGDDPLAPLVRELGVESFVELRGWLTDDEVESLYASATAMVLPTLFEGFGLPVIEAMARGCPVLCSDIPVLREVGGGAALYVNPHSASALADQISSVLADPLRLAALSSAGRSRAAKFSWTRTAAQTASAFRRALDAPSREA